MLVLSRMSEQGVVLKADGGCEITVKVLAINGKRVKLGFSAPREVQVLRAEVASREPRGSPRQRPARD